jgi:hypothetical protein
MSRPWPYTIEINLDDVPEAYVQELTTHLTQLIREDSRDRGQGPYDWDVQYRIRDRAAIERHLHPEADMPGEVTP